MKVSRVQVAKNRKKLVAEASRLFRERGVSGVNVAEIMDAAGLTHGAFYGYFPSKDALVAESLGNALAKSVTELEGGRSQYIENYLSPKHRDDSGSGCVMGALASEIARQPAGVRETLTQELKKLLHHLGRSGGGSEEQRHRAAISIVASTVGAIALSRMVNDPKLSDEILAATRDYLEPTR